MQAKQRSSMCSHQLAQERKQLEAVKAVAEPVLAHALRLEHPENAGVQIGVWQLGILEALLPYQFLSRFLIGGLRAGWRGQTFGERQTANGRGNVKILWATTQLALAVHTRTRQSVISSG